MASAMHNLCHLVAAGTHSAVHVDCSAFPCSARGFRTYGTSLLVTPPYCLTLARVACGACVRAW